MRGSICTECQDFYSGQVCECEQVMIVESWNFDLNEYLAGLYLYNMTDYNKWFSSIMLPIISPSKSASIVSLNSQNETKLDKLEQDEVDLKLNI